MATSLKRKASALIGITATAVGSYTAPSVTTGVTISSLVIANALTTGANILVTCYIFDGTTQVNLCVNALIISGGSITLADQGTRHTLNAGDQVFVKSNTPASADVNMSVAEIT